MFSKLVISKERVIIFLVIIGLMICGIGSIGGIGGIGGIGCIGKHQSRITRGSFTLSLLYLPPSLSLSLSLSLSSFSFLSLVLFLSFSLSFYTLHTYTHTHIHTQYSHIHVHKPIVQCRGCLYPYFFILMT